MVCITRSNKNAYSETFISNQISIISQNFEVKVIHTEWLPQKDENNQFLNPWFFVIIHKLIKNLLKKEDTYFSLYGLNKYLNKNRFDVLIANYGITGVKVWKSCKKYKVPLIVHFHGFDAYHYATLKKYRESYKKMFAYASAIIAVSTDMKNKLVTLGASENKLFTIPYGVNIKKFTLNDVILSKPIFIAIGRFTPKKAPDITIKAFNEVLKNQPDAILIMVGGKEEMFNDCVCLTQKLGITKSVIFKGILNHHEIITLLHQSRAFVQHSVVAQDGDSEGTPNAILEAAACGLPIVSTLHTGIKEAVIHGVTGFLTNEYDFEKMGEYMTVLAKDPVLAERMGLEGRKHIEKNYSQELQSTRLLNLINTITLTKKNCKT